MQASPLVYTCASECGGTDSHACHSGVRDFPELRGYPRVPLGLLNLGFHFGSVVMRLLEVACVRAVLTRCFPGIARVFPSCVGSSEPRISFCPRFHAFPRSGMRACKAHPLLCTCGSNAGGTNSHSYHSGVRDFPELHVYSRDSLGLVNLGFHFGSVVMRFVEVACVRARLTPCFAHVIHSAQPRTLTHASPAPLISRSFASIPELAGMQLGRPLFLRDVLFIPTSHWTSQPTN